MTQGRAVIIEGIAAGAVASGAVADGAVVTLGAKADARSTATDTTAITAMQVLKEISYMLQNPAAGPVDRPVTVTNATGAGAMSATTALSADFALNAVTVHFSAAPTTSENLIIKIDALDGAGYDTTLYLTNPSVGAVTDILFQPDHPLLCENGDHIVVTFTNTDTRTYGVRIVTEAV